MTDVQQKTIDKTKKLRHKKSDLEDFKLWLAGLGLVSVPALHVNGVNHSMAVLTVDFGTPLEESNKLSTEQGADLVGKMKALTRTFFKNEVNVRVQSDTNNGVWWTSVN